MGPVQRARLNQTHSNAEGTMPLQKIALFAFPLTAMTDGC